MKFANLFLFHKKDRFYSKNNEAWFFRNFENDSFEKKDFAYDSKKTLIITNDLKSTFCPVHFKWEKIHEIKNHENEEIVQTKNQCCFKNFTKIRYYDKQIKNISAVQESWFGDELYESVYSQAKSVFDLSYEELLSVVNQRKDFNNAVAEYDEWKKSGKKSCKGLVDFNSINRDIFCYKVQADFENFKLKIVQYVMNRSWLSKLFPFTTTKISQIPVYTESLEFDIASAQINEELKTFKFNDNSFNEGVHIPDSVCEFCLEQLKLLISTQFNRKINFPSYSVDNANKRNDHNFYLANLDKLKALFYFPYDWGIYYLDIFGYSGEYMEKEYKVLRKDTNCFKNFCKMREVKETKTIRRAFEKSPDSFEVYKKLVDCDFKDMNIIGYIINLENQSLIRKNLHASSVKFFLKWALSVKGEKSAWHLLEKSGINTATIDDRQNEYLRDGSAIFQRYFSVLPPEIVSAVLSDGFNRYNHDVLSKFSREFDEKNITFTYTDKEKSLTDNIDDYSFLLPEDSDTLKTIAQVLHNCVAGYKDRVLRKDCTIVYVTKANRIVLCIEVRKDTVHQWREDRNQDPSGKNLIVLNKWLKSHNLVFFGNHY